jgi:hypothetical protein
VSDLSVRAVLDATAIAAYARGSVDVGEILAEITDEGTGFAVPDLCLIEAAQLVDVDDWPALDLLVAHSQCVRLELHANWRDLAAAARQLGGTGRAAAMLAAVDLRAYLLTAEPNAFGDDAPLVIGI